jgi:hypothetical protein
MKLMLDTKLVKANMNVMAKASEMKVGDMKGHFKWL